MCKPKGMTDYLSEISYIEEDIIVHILLSANLPCLTRVNKRIREIYVRNENRLIVCRINSFVTVYELFGKCHRNNDLPAVVHFDGTREWYQYGKCHRDNDLPASIDANGTREWWRHGKLHRDNDLPAIVYTNGEQFWCRRGKIHRDNDLPAVVCENGDQKWWQHNRPHRDNGLPAVIMANGNREWWVRGVCIRST